MSAVTRITSLTDNSFDRRLAHRIDCVHCHRIRSARTRTGDKVSVINVSAAGMLFETVRRLLPGSVVELQMEIDIDRAIVRGRILRCMVTQLRAAGVIYCGAVLFERHLPWFVDEPACALSRPDRRPARPDRAHATQTVL